LADSIDDDWESSSKSSTRSGVPEAADRAPTSDRADHYRVNVGGDEVAVMSTLEMLEALKTGRVSGQSLVWKKGMSDWAELKRVPALALLLPSPPKVPGTASTPLKTNPPSAPPPSAPATGSPLSPVTPVGARRAALPRNPVTRADLSAVRSTSPPVPRPSRPSMASIHPGVLSPLGSKPSNPRPSTPVASRHDDDDDDDGVTQVVSNAKMIQELREARAKAPALPPPAPEPDDKALAVYDRPLATLAFAEGITEDAEVKPPALPDRPASVAPARIISVGPSEPPPAPSRSAPPPPSRPVPPPSRPASSAPIQGAAALPARPRQPSLPSIVVAPAPAAPAPATSLVPDSLDPVTTPAPVPSDGAAAEQEYTHAGKRRRTLVTRNLVFASAGSALFASIVTAIAVHRPEPTPLVIAPTVPAASSVVTAAPPPVRAPEPPPRESVSAVPVLSLSALPKAAPKVARPKADGPSPVPTAPPSFLAETADGAKPKPEKSALDENPYGVELEDEEPAPKAKPVNPAPAWLQEGLKGDDAPSAESPGF
jgi:hypothetical protein